MNRECKNWIALQLNEECSKKGEKKEEDCVQTAGTYREEIMNRKYIV
jgi:hypothetical protein